MVLSNLFIFSCWKNELNFQLIHQLPQKEEYRPLGMSFYKNGLYVSTSGDKDTPYSSTTTTNILHLDLDKLNGKTLPRTLFTTDGGSEIKVYDPSLQKGQQMKWNGITTSLTSILSLFSRDEWVQWEQWMSSTLFWNSSCSIFCL